MRLRTPRQRIHCAKHSYLLEQFTQWFFLFFSSFSSCFGPATSFLGFQWYTTLRSIRFPRTRSREFLRQHSPRSRLSCFFCPDFFLWEYTEYNKCSRFSKTKKFFSSSENTGSSWLRPLLIFLFRSMLPLSRRFFSSSGWTITLTHGSSPRGASSTSNSKGFLAGTLLKFPFHAYRI